MSILLKNIRVINPVENLDKNLYIKINDGIITECSENQIDSENSDHIIDGESLVCAPGFMDMHVHLREPGLEYKEDIASGCASAANGGFTAICCMPNTEPTIDEASVVELIKHKAKGKATDVFISASITQGRDGKHISPMLELADCGVVMFTDDGACVMDSEVLKRAFNYASVKNLLISQHCEDKTLTQNFAINEGFWSFKLGLKGYPAVAEEIMIARDLMLAEYCDNVRYHVSHVSTKRGIALIRQAKARGINVTCEVTPHHFTLTDDKVATYNTNLKMNPPLRRSEDIDAIIEGLKDNTIDCIASDHAPHALHEKEVEFDIAPYGILGLETSVGLALTKLYHTSALSLSQVIEKYSVNPRKILNLPEIQIKVGEMANLSIFAPDEEWVVKVNRFKSKSTNTPFEDYILTGKPKYIINNKQLIQSSL